MLLLGDSQFRRMSCVATDVFAEACSVQTLFKPIAGFEGVVQDLGTLAGSFTRSDCGDLCGNQ